MRTPQLSAEEVVRSEVKALDPRSSRGRRWRSIVEHICLWLGLSLCAVFICYGHLIPEGKPIIYAGTVMIDLVAIGNLDDFRRWRQGKYYLSRGVMLVYMAPLLTGWALLCLLGVINY